MVTYPSSIDHPQDADVSVILIDHFPITVLQFFRGIYKNMTVELSREWMNLLKDHASILSSLFFKAFCP